MKRIILSLMALVAFSVCSVAQNGVINGHKYVDLGLPSGTLWATANIGASTPEQAGNYYAWGDTRITTSYPDPDEVENDCGTSKDLLASFVHPNHKSIAGTKYDVAHVRWGESWKMPTKDQFDELMSSSNCTWTWVRGNRMQGKVGGYKITSKKNGNSIFLPAAGSKKFRGHVMELGFWGYYWTATPFYGHACAANLALFEENGRGFFTRGGFGVINRHEGCPVRPVATRQISTAKKQTTNNSKSTTTKPKQTTPTKPAQPEQKPVEKPKPPQNGMNNGHEYVDLGLPSGLKWATCNVGASKPEEYGNFFSWGETQPRTNYDRKNPTFGMKKYDLRDSGIIDDNDLLTKNYDAAAKNWGSNWRMPTSTEFRELIDNCTWARTELNGVTGILFTSKKYGNSIFLPAAGGLERSDHRFDAGIVGKDAHYWSSKAETFFTSSAYYLNFNAPRSININNNSIGDNWRLYACSIRPVCVVKNATSSSNIATTSSNVSKPATTSSNGGAGGQVVLERKYKVHHGGKYNETHIDICFSDDMFLRIAYLRTDYWQSYSHSINGIHLLTKGAWHNPANTKDIWKVGSLVLDEWVKEKVVINPDGWVEYFMNDRSIGKYKFNEIDLSKAQYVKVSMSPYGWWTGHRHHMDDFVLTTPAGTYRDNFDDGVLDTSIWQRPKIPDGVREENGIVKAEQIQTDVDYSLNTKSFPYSKGSK